MYRIVSYHSLSTSGITSYNKLHMRYSTNSGERELRPYHEKPATHLIF